MVSGIPKKQWPSRDFLVPDRPLEDGSPTRLPEIPTGKQGAAARRTGWRIDGSIGEENSLPGQFIEIRGLGHIVDATCALDLGINGSLPSPVVGKSEKNIRSFCLISTKRFQGKDKTNCKDSIEHKGFRVKEQKPTNSKQSIGVFLFGRTKIQMKHYSDAD